MNLRQLQYVLALAKTQNFTKTASELYITQPFLSSQISMIESELGVKLFDRSTRIVSLTEAGQTFCEKASRVIADYEDMFSSMEPYRNHHAVPLRIGVSFRAQCSPVLDACIRFFSSHSEYEVSYLDEGPTEIAEGIQAGTLDAGICRLNTNLDKPHFHSSLRTVPLLQELSCFVMSQQHPLANRKSLRLADLQEHTLLLGLEGSLEDQGLKNYAKQYHLPPFHVIRSNNISIIIRLLKEGKGVIMAPKSVADYYGLIAVANENAEYGQLGLVYDAKSSKSILATLEQYLLDIYVSQEPDSEDM